MNYPPKVEGQICSQCGKGKYVKSPKTGKIFCSEKCWLQGQEQSAPQPATPPRDFKMENFGKCKYGFLLEAYKKGIALADAEVIAEEWADASLRKLNNEPDVSNIPF